jgi:hypothetical protein
VPSLSEVNGELDREEYKGRNSTKFLIMHCYDLKLRFPRGGRDSTSTVLWISGVNHHH